MKFYTQQILDVLKDKIAENHTNIIRLEYFNHPEVYLRICNDLGNKTKFIAKLARPKYDEFKENTNIEFQKALKKLEDNDLLDNERSMTLWRNNAANFDGTILLMGTESVEDRGGLADFLVINPSIIEDNLGNNYSNWVEEIVYDLDDDARSLIDTFFAELFRYVPKDLIKLSNNFEKIAANGKITTDEFIELNTRKLYVNWEVPNLFINRYSRFFKKNNVDKLIKKAMSFKSRSDFKNGLSKSKFEKMTTKIKQFSDSNPDVTEDINMRYSKMYNSYDEFSNALLNYVAGVSINQERPKLLQCDFVLVDQILGLKLKSDNTSTNSVKNIEGEPIEFFLRSFFSILEDFMKEELSSENYIHKVEYELISAKLADCETETDIRTSWLRLCYNVGGILHFLNDEIWEYNGEKFNFGYKDYEDLFAPTIFENITEIISKESRLSKKTKLEFYVRITGDEIIIEKEFVWQIDVNSEWLRNFDIIHSCFKALVEENKKPLIPYGFQQDIYQISTATNSIDFFAAFENKHIDFSTNICDIVEEHSINSELLAKTKSLGKAFCDFCLSLMEKGFFKSSRIEFIRTYVEFLKYIISNSISNSIKNTYFYLCNSFLISDSEDMGVNELGLPCAIVPPYHPIMIEKMDAKFDFIRKGAKESFYSVIKGEKTDIEKWFEKLNQFSTISSGAEVIQSEKHHQYLVTTNVFGYYAIYLDEKKESKRILSSLGRNNLDVVADEDFKQNEIKASTPLSKLISNYIIEYMNTFPSSIDGLRLSFVNFTDLQPIISGVHNFVSTAKKKFSDVKLELNIFTSSVYNSGVNYIKYWLDTFFEEDDNVSITTYCKYFDHNQQQKNLSDIIFVQNFMEEKEIFFQPMFEYKKSIRDTRFPMIYTLQPTSKDSKGRALTLSQPQFEGSHYHAQLVNKIDDPYLKEDNYRVVSSRKISQKWEEIIDYFHTISRWVVCIDESIDKDILHKDRNRIISFTTGQGPFGEYNLTVSAKEDIQNDIAKRLKRKLKERFPRWSKEILENATEYCINYAKQLDGIQLLKALNPNDYAIHDFLAYILTAEEANFTNDKNDYLIRTLVHLDSYKHWFESDECLRQPDFLLLEVKDQSPVQIKATLIECKMGEESEKQIESAIDQIKKGYDKLSRHWNPNNQSIMRKYWFAQLYRVLVFSRINLHDNDPKYNQFVKRVNDIIDGKFNIEWDAYIYAYWLNENSDKLPSEVINIDGGVKCTCNKFGQLYIQKMLQWPEKRNYREVEFMPLIIEAISENEEDMLSDVQILPENTSVSNNQSESSNQMPIISDMTQVAVSSESSNVIEKENFEVKDIRILIGIEKYTKAEVFWEFGHPHLSNRHLLILGNSGVGKTYLIQCMLLELAKNGISSIIFDYTDGFTESKLEPEIVEFLGDNIVEFPVYNQPFPLNPFKRHHREIAGNYMQEKDVDVAERIKSVFQAVYSLGPQQASAVYKATRNGLKKYGDTMNLDYLRVCLEELTNDMANAKTVISKIEPMVDREPFDSTQEMKWSDLRDDKGKIFIIQLSGFTRDVQILMTELILWDAWYFNLKVGSKEIPFPVVLDEAQNLNHRQNSPTTKILTEGRKFGWSGWFATQFMKEQLRKDEIQRLQQASQKIYFNPPESEIVDISGHIETDRSKREEWQKRLSKLKKGECIVVGDSLRNGILDKRVIQVVKVTSLAERIKKNG